MIAQKQQNNLNKKIQMQNMIIIALAIVIIVLIVVSSTAAWYIRTKSDSTDLILSRPVNIYITEYTTGQGGETIHTVKKDILEDYDNRIYPGDRVKLNLGMVIGSADDPSSNAFVRVKLQMAFSKLGDNGVEEPIAMEDLRDQRLIEYQNEPDGEMWELIDFNDPEGKLEKNADYVPDYWYVLKTKDAYGNDIAREALDGQTFEFVNGFIKLSKTEITNKHANCSFHILYVVEAIQSKNVPDPVKYPGYGPWYNFMYGDVEDVQG
ncbi:MAG: hypothetical protein IJW59_01090 [Clostridia bacterium]|nr:hypothetical protein [Clostridia bacterium]